MKASEQYFPSVLFIMLYKVVLSFESLDEILKSDHENENSSSHHIPIAAVCFSTLHRITLSIDFFVKFSISENSFRKKSKHKTPAYLTM